MVKALARVVSSVQVEETIHYLMCFVYFAIVTNFIVLHVIFEGEFCHLAVFRIDVKVKLVQNIFVHGMIRTNSQ